MAPVRVTQKVRAVEILKNPPGNILVDFGQKLVGKILIPSLH